MAERMFRVTRDGIPQFEIHLAPNQSVFLQEDDEGTTATIAEQPPTEAEVEASEEVFETAPPLAQNFDEMTVEELKGLLRDKDLPVSGSKANLVYRLNEAE